MRIKNITVFLSFFLSFPEFFLVIRYFVWESQFSCGSWQDWRDHRPTHHPAHAGFRPRTTMNHFYMNDDAIGRFSFSALLLEFLPLFWFSACYLVTVATFLLIVVFWQVSWLFWSFPSNLLLERFSFYVFIFEAFQWIFCPFLILCKVVNLYVQRK